MKLHNRLLLVSILSISMFAFMKGMAQDVTLQVRASVPVRVIRSLLTTPRRETEAFCLSHGVQSRRDPSIDNPMFARNRLRHQVVRKRLVVELML